MNESKIRTVTGMCIIALTRNIMECQGLEFEDAYRRLLGTELYTLLNDAETRLFIETNEYLAGAYDAEQAQGKEGLYEYINNEN